MCGTQTNKAHKLLGLWGSPDQEPFSFFSSVWEDSCWGSTKTQVSTIQTRPSHYQTNAKRQISLHDLRHGITEKRQRTSRSIRHWACWTSKTHQSHLSHSDTCWAYHYTVRDSQRVQCSIFWSKACSAESSDCVKRSQFSYAANGCGNGKG